MESRHKRRTLLPPHPPLVMEAAAFASSWRICPWAADESCLQASILLMSTSKGSSDRPSMLSGFDIPAMPRNVGAKSTSVAGS
eukprot:CAMPEP_0115888930 /NCGR_PEP_ID=MMETSP0287-20121206/32561_1 /TAXON_ID=412157 /ORGANISM="Chrysochromulina rotalis, Strain UIO044" /LENGTH=82 /DNA_ID=CAMNT_0003345629 /DNA_START=441 /DNA_END=689 /DNA_ORIENTATION=-